MTEDTSPAPGRSPAPPTTPRSLWQGGALAAIRSPSRSGSKALRRAALLTFFAFEVICLTLLQKFSLPVDTGGSTGGLEVALPLTYVGLGALAFFVKFKVDFTRLILLVAWLLFAFLTVMLLPIPYSVNSILLAIVTYLPFFLYVEVSESTFRKMMSIFLNVMIAFDVIGLLQHVIQLIWSAKYWPDPEKIFPREIMYSGYVYLQPIKWGAKFMKPNGIFFLEVSLFSQWTAVALALELVYFRRLWRMIFYGFVLFASFAGTGLLLMLICSPVLLTRLSRRSIAIVGVVFVVLVAGAIGINWYGSVEHRFTEVFQYGSSANDRFIVPFQVLADLFKHPASVFAGNGPGSSAKDLGDTWWTFTKVAYEYGLVTAVLFTIFMGYVLFKNAPSGRIAFVLMILFNFMAGFLIPVYPLLLFLLGGFFRIRTRKSDSSESSSSHSRSGSSDWTPKLGWATASGAPVGGGSGKPRSDAGRESKGSSQT
jgi:hypothetical protein